MPFLEDLFKKELCECGHSIEEEHLNDGQCYALDFNGAIYSACNCKHAIPMKLTFKIERNEISNNTETRIIQSRKPNMQVKPKPAIFQWRGKQTLQTHSR